MKKRVVLSCFSFYALFVLTAHPDSMPVTFEDTDKPNASNPGTADFFTLETVDFSLRNKSDAGGTKPFSAISLTPAGMGQFVERKKGDLAQEYALRAEECIKRNDMDGAIKEIDKALLRDPDDMQLLGRAGLIYAAAKQYEQASSMLRLYLQNFPDQANHMAAWGGVLLRLNDLDTSAIMLDRAIHLDPGNPTARYQSEILAQLQETRVTDLRFWPLLDVVRFRMVLGFLLNDREELERLLGPERFSAICDRIIGEGTAARLDVLRDTLDKYVEIQRSPERDAPGTIEACELLVGMGCNNQSIRMSLAQTSFDSERIEEAWKIIRQVQQDYPEYQVAWFNGGLIALQTANYELAEVMFKKSLSLHQDGMTYFALASSYACLGRIDEAWTILKQLKKTDPENLKQWLEGDNEYLMVIKRDPRYEEISP